MLGEPVVDILYARLKIDILQEYMRNGTVMYIVNTVSSDCVVQVQMQLRDQILSQAHEELKNEQQ